MGNSGFGHLALPTANVLSSCLASGQPPAGAGAASEILIWNPMARRGTTLPVFFTNSSASEVREKIRRVAPLLPGLGIRRQPGPVRSKATILRGGGQLLRFRGGHHHQQHKGTNSMSSDPTMRDVWLEYHRKLADVEYALARQAALTKDVGAEAKHLRDGNFHADAIRVLKSQEGGQADA